MTNRVTEAASRAGTYASDTVEAARARAASATGKTVEGIEGNPLAALAAGIALGAVIGALLPRTEKERELLGGIGGKINDAARSAVTAAKDAGRGTLDEYGLNRDAARSQVDKLVEAAVKTAGAASDAATKSVRGV